MFGFKGKPHSETNHLWDVRRRNKKHTHTHLPPYLHHWLQSLIEARAERPMAIEGADQGVPALEMRDAEVILIRRGVLATSGDIWRHLAADGSGAHLQVSLLISKGRRVRRFAGQIELCKPFQTREFVDDLLDAM